MSWSRWAGPVKARLASGPRLGTDQVPSTGLRFLADCGSGASAFAVDRELPWAVRSVRALARMTAGARLIYAPGAAKRVPGRRGSHRDAARGLHGRHRPARQREGRPGGHVRTRLGPAGWPGSVLSGACRRGCAGLRQLHRRPCPARVDAGCARRRRVAGQPRVLSPADVAVRRRAAAPVREDRPAGQAGYYVRAHRPRPVHQQARHRTGFACHAQRPVRVGNCAGTGGGWAAFAGGYRVDHPACVPVIVRAGGKEQQVHIGVGTACPGQQPPQVPTQS